MATNDPKKHSITGNLVANMLTEREDDYTFNVTTQPIEQSKTFANWPPKVKVNSQPPN